MLHSDKLTRQNFNNSMKHILLSIALFVIFTATAQKTVQDDFEGNGTITSWHGDDCSLDIEYSNPYRMGINTSAIVLRYHDTGGQYANVRFDVSENFDLSEHATFKLKIYIPSSEITGGSPNQISLKLQDGMLGAPWSTQSEIIKPVALNQWQEISFNFKTDNFINLDGGSLPPTQRSDFNRVLLQVNGENNNDQVVAYIDDIEWDGSFKEAAVYDKLIWSDEFEEDGAIDSEKWFHQTKLPIGGSWYNGEIQHYTNRLDNSNVENGVLKIVAKKETFHDQGHTKNYTSARLNSKFAFTYGKVEIKAKLPTGGGTWPALWMLGKNIQEIGAYWQTQGFGTTPWPACGEIDIMEHWGHNQNYVQSAMHTPSSYGGTINHGGQSIPTVSTQFHVYEMLWTADKIVFSVDGNHHYTYNPSVKNAETWPYDADQYFIFNIAIEPTITSSFTQSAMEVEYIRVYQQSVANSPELTEDRNQIKVYPNPVLNEITISLPQTSNNLAQVRIYTLEGKAVLQKNIKAESSNLRIDNLSYLKKGVYILRVQHGELVYSTKLIKQ